MSELTAFLPAFLIATPAAMLAASVYALVYAAIAALLDVRSGPAHIIAICVGAVGIAGAVMLAAYNWPHLFY